MGFGTADEDMEGHLKKLPVADDGEDIVPDEPKEATEWKVEVDDRETRSEVEDAREVEGVE